jgi:hypothetical protein
MPGATTARVGRVGVRDPDERVHDPVDGAEQADEGTVGTDRGQVLHAAREATRQSRLHRADRVLRTANGGVAVLAGDGETGLDG